MAKDILPQLRSDGRVTRGWLGVMINPVRPEFQEHLDVESDKGALVSQVLPGGPAASAGIEEYDIIVEFDGDNVNDMNDLPRIVARTPVDKKVKVVVLRKGKRKTLTARIGAMPESPETVVAKVESGESAFGLNVQKVTPELARQLGISEVEGVVVTSVEPGGPASEAGLRRRDVILEVNRESIDDEEGLREKLGDVSTSALLLVRRGDATLFVALKRDVG
jgi:serine protease Do